MPGVPTPQTQMPRAPSLPPPPVWLPDMGLLDAMRADPATMPAEKRAAALAHLKALDNWLHPAHPATILAIVSRLMLHWSDTKTKPAEMEAMLEDWVEALADLPEHALRQAAAGYLKACSYRPKPADIRALAVEAIREERDARLRLHKLLAPAASI